MKPHERQSPRQVGGLGRAEIGLRHSQHALNIKDHFNPQAYPLTTAGVYIFRRFRVRSDIADLVASLAGLGPNRRAVQ
jgi:hypothetical protein